MEQVKEEKINQEMAVKLDRKKMVIKQVDMNQILLMEVDLIVLQQERQERKK